MIPYRVTDVLNVHQGGFGEILIPDDKISPNYVNCCQIYNLPDESMVILHVHRAYGKGFDNVHHCFRDASGEIILEGVTIWKWNGLGK